MGDDIQPQLPGVTRPRLWSPNPAANWSILLTPVFGAFLHAANWRALGRPDRAAANTVWMWVSLGFLAVNLIGVLVPESRAIDGVLRLIGFGLLLGWYFTQGRPQARFVKENLGEDYERRGWALPLLAGFAALAVYVYLVFGLAVATYKPEPSDLAAEVKPLILQECQKTPATRDATIQAATLTHKGGKTYSGTVEATISGRPQKFTLEVVAEGTNLSWQVQPIDAPPDFGTRVEYNGDVLFYTPSITADEARRVGQYLVKESFFDGQQKVVQLNKTGRTYEFRFPVKRGVEQVVGQFGIGFFGADRSSISGRVESGHEQARQAAPGCEPARQARR